LTEVTTDRSDPPPSTIDQHGH